MYPPAKHSYLANVPANIKQGIDNYMRLCRLLKEDMKRLEVKGTGFFTMLSCLVVRPGFLAVFIWRLSSVAVHKGIVGRIIAKFLWRLNVLLNACDMEPLAIIEGGFHVPHPMGVVFGRIKAGKNFKVHQNVALGMRRFTDDYRDFANYAQIGENVTISVGAVITGPLKIGSGAIVGANCVLTCDVPEKGLAVGIPSRIVQPKAEKANND